MIFTTSSYCAAGLLVALIATALWGQQSQQSTPASTAVKTLLSHPFTQTKVADCVDAAPAVSWRNGIQLSYSAEGLGVNGKDFEGRSWKTIIPASGVFTCEIWSARLTGQGSDDLAVINYGHNRDGYDAELTLLIFDEKGRPAPWRATGHFTSSENGVAEIVTSPNGSAEIIASSRVGERRDGYAYISSLYRASGTGLHLLTGTLPEGVWPVISGNAALLTGSEGKDSRSVDLNVNQEGASVQAKPQIVRVLSPSAAQPAAHPMDSTSLCTARAANPDIAGSLDEPKLVLSNQTTSPLPRIVVADKADGTRVIFFAQNVPEGVNELRQGKYSVQPMGQSCEEDDCRSFILWGTQK